MRKMKTRKKPSVRKCVHKTVYTVLKRVFKKKISQWKKGCLVRAGEKKIVCRGIFVEQYIMHVGQELYSIGAYNI